MKIAYLLGSLNRGGTETLLLDCFQNANMMPYQRVGLYRKEGVLLSEFKQTSVKLTKLTPRFFGDINYLFRLRKTLKREKINIVHAQQTLDTVYARLALIGCKVKVIQTFHGYDFNFKFIDKIICRLAIKITDCNIFVSETLKNYYISTYRLNPVKQHVVYNGISFSKFIRNDSVNLRNELNIESDMPIFGMVGSFTSVRDQFTVCRFLNELNLSKVDFRFLFIGGKIDSEPSFYDMCIEYCKQHDLTNKVMFLGVRNDVPDILQQLDAFIYSSHHDTFGIAVIEAIGAGIVVFVNDWDVMQEITENGNLAVLYKSKDEKDLTLKVMHYIQNKSFYLEQAKQSAIKVKQTFSIESHIYNLYKLYQSINANK